MAKLKVDVLIEWQGVSAANIRRMDAAVEPYMVSPFLARLKLVMSEKGCCRIFGL
jgi:hypothetical protein